MTPTFLIWLAPALPAAAVITYGLRHRSTGMRIDASVRLLAAALLLSTLAITPTWRFRPLVAWAYAAVVYGAVLVFALRLRDRIGYRMTVGTMVAAALAVFSVVPVAVLPALSPGPLTPTLDERPIRIDLETVRDSLQHIRASVRETARRAEEERRKIDEATAHLLETVEDRSDQARKIDVENRRLLDELERYHQLAALTESQAKAIATTLQRNRWLDYAVSALSGLLSSILVPLARRLGRS